MFCFLTVYVTRNNAEQEYVTIYNRLQKETLQFNGAINSSSASSGETPLFSDAKTAVSSAYAKIMDSESYELYAICDLNLTITAVGINIPIIMKMNQTMAKYPSGHHFTEAKRYETGGSHGQNMATKRVYKNGKCYKTVSYDISYNASTQTISANYTAPYAYDYDGEYATYVINPSTIKSELYFKVNYNVYTGKIESYSASVALNPLKAVEEYGKLSQYESDFVAPAKYSKLEFHCIIDTAGNLVSATIYEKFTATMNSFGGVGLSSDNCYNLYVISTTGTTNPEPNF